jgi:MOB kinase activator 1
MSNIFFPRNNKTFRPKRNTKDRFQLSPHAEATLGSGDLRMATKLPEGEDLNEWVACNVVDFYNQINMLYGTIADDCTKENCPVMNAGPKVEYYWADEQVKRPIRLSAPDYCDRLFAWIQDQTDDETIFPSAIGDPFPKDFLSISKKIIRRLFRIYAHVYHAHFNQILLQKEQTHINTSFKHFIFFVQEFKLMNDKELQPLQPLIDRLIKRDQERYGWDRT